MGWLWSSYNLIMIGIALLILIDAPKPNIDEWFDLRRVVKLSIDENHLWGVTTSISLSGAEIALTTNTLINLEEFTTIQLEIAESNLLMEAEIIRIRFNDDEYPTIRIKFASMSLKQYRHLVEMLFCRPGQWKRNKTPGEFKSLLLIFRILLKPQIFVDRNVNVSPITVAKV